jgi:hypothetical chaperone protein
VDEGATMPAAGAIGVDFGTTNTVISRLDDDGHADLVSFPAEGEEVVAFRSALSFHPDLHDETRRVIEAGPWAIEAYAEEPIETRLIQSFKSYAASPFEDMLSAFLLRMRAHAPVGLSDLPERVIVGRPVEFAGAHPDSDLALRRYQTAFERLGFKEVRYAFEPVAAAFFFARMLTSDAVVLVGDFGGGTSDFSIARFRRQAGAIRAEALANSGVGVAGDAFDYRIIDAVVSPELGKGSAYRAFDHVLPIPARYYAAFARWEQLALLRASADMRDIRRLRRDALEPEKFARLVEILDDNHGYQLYRAVSRLKQALSDSPEATFLLEAGSVRLEKQVERNEFEGWIAPELAAIEAALDRVLGRAGLGPEGIDRVFLTGGSSFVPAVRQIFARRFGTEKLEGGSELVSIASGLAYIGREPDLDAWSARIA